jgi:hypothetical protein
LFASRACAALANNCRKDSVKIAGSAWLR